MFGQCSFEISEYVQFERKEFVVRMINYTVWRRQYGWDGDNQGAVNKEEARKAPSPQ